MANPSKEEAILERLARKEITPRQAIAQLIAGGLDSASAGETVLMALGGSDLIEIGADGLKRYHSSGRLVDEVEAEMRGETPIERIDIMDYSGDPAKPELLCSFFWSELAGVSCTSGEIMDRLTETGIAAPLKGDRVFPTDGRAFFDALKYRYSGLLRAQPALRVGHQGGKRVG